MAWLPFSWQFTIHLDSPSPLFGIFMIVFRKNRNENHPEDGSNNEEKSP